MPAGTFREWERNVFTGDGVMDIAVLIDNDS